jgi:hypothetical protein
MRHYYRMPRWPIPDCSRSWTLSAYAACSALGARNTVLPAAAQQVSTHWLRHTTLTWVERRFGYAVARAYAGHTDSGSAGTTVTYIRADIHEVAAALAALTGEAHPLANSTAP